MLDDKTITTRPVLTGLPEAEWVPASTRPAVGLGLRQIMLLLVYCAIASLIGRPVFESRSALHLALLGIWLGLGVCYLGLWLAFRLGELAVIGWIIFLTGYITVSASMMGWLAIPVIPIVVGVIIYLHIQYRRTQQKGLVWVLAVAADRQIPLAPGVEAYAGQTRGVFGERAHAVATLLHRGKSLPEAIDLVPRSVPWDAAILIAVGERIGQLARGLRAATDARTQGDRVFRDLIGRLGYLGLIVFVAQVVIGFSAYFIVPRIEAIFKDFNAQLPPITELFLTATYYFSEYAPWIGLAELVALVYLVIVLSSRGWQGLPVVGRLFRYQHKAVILKSLALGVDSGQPIDRAVAALVDHYPSVRVRRKLQVAYDLIRSGVNWTAALDGVGLITIREVALLDAASRAGNLAWVLRTLAEAGERRLEYRLQVSSNVAFLAVILLLGALVLFFCLALFAPLVHLIERLAE